MYLLDYSPLPPLTMDFDSEDTVKGETYINDVRDSSDLRQVSFSNYKKTEVKNILLDNMLKYKIEPAFYWCAELLCAGHFMDIWELILYFFGKHIHLGNPKLIVYLDNRFQVFRNVISQTMYTNDLQIRNNIKIRKLFMELICVLTYSPRKPTIELTKINRQEEFDITQITEKLKAPTIEFAKVIYDKDDPKELFIAINEFSYHISKRSGGAAGQNMIQACYWIEWIIEFDAVCKKRKQICRCKKRDFLPPYVETKYSRDVIWMIWDSLFHYANQDNHGDFKLKLLQSILQLFSIKYTAATTKRRRYLLYFAVSILIEPVPTNVEIISKEHKAVLASALSQIELIYRQIKQSEQTPQTDYLFHNIKEMQSGDSRPYNMLPIGSRNAPKVFHDDDD